MKKLKEFLVFCLSTALSLSLLAACGKPQIPMAGAETPAEPSSAASEGSLRVMASFYPMYDFAQKIGGDKVTVTNMVPAGTEPHDWEPSPSDIVALEQADVFVYSGAGMEHWVEDVLASLDNQSLVTVEASYGIALLEGHHHHHEDEEEAEHEHEDEHEHEEGGGYDPHVWLSPLNAKREMENYERRKVYHRAYYSLDAYSWLENYALEHSRSPEDILLEREEMTTRLYLIAALPVALAHATPTQARRVHAYYIAGIKQPEISRREGIHSSKVSVAIRRGLRNMRRCYDGLFQTE